MLYNPAHFSVEDAGAAAALMRAHPLATLVSLQDGQPQVTHAPLLLDDTTEPWRLLGHVARANPHWQAWTEETALLAIFHGPDAYVSPALYDTPKAVPTWNYAVVHVQGRVTPLHDSEAKEDVLKRLIDAHDLPYHQQWNELDVTYREGMKKGIVAFALQVERIDAKFKLSQNRAPAERERVRRAMAAGGAGARELAEWMQRLQP